MEMEKEVESEEGRVGKECEGGTRKGRDGDGSGGGK